MKEGKNFEMAIKIHLRRCTSVLLCCLLVFCSIPIKAHATDPVTAASLAITGGQLAGAGLSGEAVLSLAGPVGAVVGVTLGALGVNAYVSKAAQEAGKTRTRFVLDKLVIWGAQAGYTQEQLYSKIAQGISVAADGTIQLGKDAAKMIEQFGSWLFTQAGEVVPSISSSSGTVVNFGSLSFPTLPYSFVSQGYFEGSAEYAFSFPTTGRNIAIAAYGTGSYVQGEQTAEFIAFGPYNEVKNITIPVSVTRTRANGSVNTTNYNKTFNNYATGSYSFFTLAAGPIFLSSLSFPTFNNYTDAVNYLRTISGWDTSTLPAYDEVFTGTPDAWAENKDVLNPSAEDTPIVLNPDLLNPIIDSLADGQQATMSIIDYLQALQDAWDHALDDVQTAIGTITDQLTGIQEQIAVPQDAVENPTVTNPSVTPDTTPILDPSTVNPGTAITGLSFDLTNIFPFCIPFDIYAALNLLDAEPVAPSYHVHLEWPYNIIIDFTIDLSPFNDVAAVARTMETLLFIVGLAVMTRSLFIRG